MNYEEACVYQCTRREAIAEIKENNLNPRDFFAEIGDRELYQGKEILDWLGY